MANYLNSLNGSLCLLPKTSVSGDWLSRLDQVRMDSEPMERSLCLSVRVYAFFLNGVLLPLGALGAVAAIVCYDLPSRLVKCLDHSATEQNKIHLLAMTIFLGTILMRIGCYLVGKRELLFPVDYKNRGFSSELDPILEMVKKPNLRESFIQEKVGARGELVAPLKPYESARERFFCNIAHQEGGVDWLRQLPSNMIKSGELNRQEFEFLVDRIIETYKYELLAEVFDLPRDGFEVPDSFIQERLEAHRQAWADPWVRFRPYWTERQKFYYTIVNQEIGIEWLREVPSDVINSSVLTQQGFTFLVRRIIQTNRFELLGQVLDLPRGRMDLAETLKEIAGIAVERRDRELLNKLVAAGLNINANVSIDDRMGPPLSEALRRAYSAEYPPETQREYRDFADFLIEEKGAWIGGGFPINEWMTFVIERRDRELLNKLVAAGLNINANVTIDGRIGSLLCAVLRRAYSPECPPETQREYLDFTDFLIGEKGARMDAGFPINEMMTIVIERIDRELLNKLVAAGLNLEENLTIDERNISPLSEAMRRACSFVYPPAMRREYLGFADFLIREKGVRIDVGIPSPWDIVLGFRNVEMARFLMQRGFRPNLWGEFDCLMTNLPLLEFLLRLDIDLSLRNRNNETYLLRAIRHDQVDAFHLFLHSGADPNERDSQWPIEIAMMKKNRAMIEALIHYRAKLNVHFSRVGGWFLSNDEADTPLTYAVSIEDVDLVRLLLKNKADRNIRRWNDRVPCFETPLEMAHKLKNRELIDLLSEGKEKEAIRFPKQVADQEKTKPSFFDRLFRRNIQARGSKGIFDDDDRKEAPPDKKPKKKLFG